VEYSVYYTDPRSADSDYDGLSDWEEVKIYNTNPVNIKIAIISDIGGRGDLSFNDMAFKGGEELRETHGVAVVELISKTWADYLRNLRAAAEDPPTILIVGVGHLLSEALAQVAQEFPDKNFIGIDTNARFLTPEPLPNLVDVVYEEHKGSALVGALGALLAAHYDKPHIGGVFGIEIPVLWKFEIGYKWGCDWAMKWYKNHYPDNYAAEPSSSIVNTPRNRRVLYIYTGTFSDITKGYLVAKAMYVENVVAVYNVAGPLGLGINQAVEEIAAAEVLDSGPPFWMGADADQDWINPGFVIASMMKRVDYGVIYGTELVRRGLFREEGIVGYPNERRALTLGIGTE
ncbi:MAG: BMP family ABC transporter substrate-binding protein, partial [Desulfitobacteriaceae bacterium]|nr:BMP family ABC transporter substrate-binding protein [Desulfitobacteriaceae bacterium]